MASPENQRPTHSPIVTAVEKMTFKFRTAIKKSTAPRREAEQQTIQNRSVPFLNTRANSDSLAILEHSSACAMRIYNYQRSTKIPLREPAGFPTNHNFSQRVLFECDDENYDDEMIPAPFSLPGQLLPAVPELASLKKDSQNQLQSSSRSHISTQTLAGRFRRSLKVFGSRSNKKSVDGRRAEFVRASDDQLAKRVSMHASNANLEDAQDAHVFTSRSSNLELSLVLPRLTQGIVDTALPLPYSGASFETPCRIAGPDPTSPVFTSSLHTPSLHAPSIEHDSRTPGVFTETSMDENLVDTQPMAGKNFNTFAPSPSPRIAFIRHMDHVRDFSLQPSPANLCCPVGRQFHQLRREPPPRRIMDTPCFSYLSDSPKPGESESMMERANVSDAESLLDPHLSYLPPRSTS